MIRRGRDVAPGNAFPSPLCRIDLLHPVSKTCRTGLEGAMAGDEKPKKINDLAVMVVLGFLTIVFLGDRLSTPV